MTETAGSKADAPDRRNLGFNRRTDNQVIAGLASGIADRLGVDVAYVRAAFVLTALASGIGVLVYGLGWLATLDDAADEANPRIAASSHPPYRNAGFGLANLGWLLTLQVVGLWPSTTLMWTSILIAYGSATIWARSDDRQRARMASVLLPTEEGRRSRRDLLIRFTLGGALVLAGLIFFLSSNATFRSLGSVVLAAIASISGLLLVGGPWIFRLVQQLGRERRDRIRSEERTELATHLHDSVLQTLALIQGSNDPQEQAVLARIQERELRTWLFEGDPGNGADHFATAVEDMAAEVEKTHQIAVEVVTVGDATMDNDLAAVVAAAREALVNVARHAGIRKASIYAEATPALVELFVTDQGSGFDPTDVDDDRKGLAESIIGRMQRHGGTATIESTPGEGTEIHLALPRSQT
jgi:signal transduction histidine kinase